MTENNFTSFDGKSIFYREWSVETPRAIIQVVHGMAESSDRYDYFAKAMNELGILVFADDHRGHGKTDDLSGYCQGNMFFDTLKDVELLTKIYKKKYEGVPLVIFGHSYGSFLTQAYLEHFGENVDGAIVGGSAYMKGIEVPVGKIITAIAKLFGKSEKQGKILAKISFGSYNKMFKEGSFISSIKEECDRYDNSWDCNFTLSYAFYHSFFRGLATLYNPQNYQKIDTQKPVYLIAGGDDPIGKMGKSVDKLYEFYRSIVGIKRVEKDIFTGVRHEYLNDTSRECAIKTISEFVLSVKAQN